MSKIHTIRTSVLAICLLGAVAVGAAMGGVAVAYQAHVFGVMRLDGDVVGVVSVVNRTGSSICLIKDSDGSELCGNVLQQPGDPLLTVGQPISATSVWISNPIGASSALVITTRRTGP